VRSYVIYQVVELEIGNRLGVHLSYSMRRPIARVQHLKLLLFQASQYQTRQVLLISIEREAGIQRVADIRQARELAEGFLK